MCHEPIARIFSKTTARKFKGSVFWTELLSGWLTRKSRRDSG
jgi:hypothetical protein